VKPKIFIYASLKEMLIKNFLKGKKMKRYLYIFTLLFFGLEIFPQTNLFTNNSPSDVIKIDSKISKYDFVPGEILIKFKDEIKPVLGKSSQGLAITGIASVDAVFAKYNITQITRLFPNEKKLQKKVILKSFNGYTFERPSLHNIHKLTVGKAADLLRAIDELKTLPQVEYAEPNYIFSIVDDKPISPELNESEMKEWLKNNPTINKINPNGSNNNTAVAGSNLRPIAPHHANPD